MLTVDDLEATLREYEHEHAKTMFDLDQAKARAAASKGAVDTVRSLLEHARAAKANRPSPVKTTFNLVDIPGEMIAAGVAEHANPEAVVGPAGQPAFIQR